MRFLFLRLKWMLGLLVASHILFASNGHAGTIIRYTCQPCGATGTLELGRGLASADNYLPYICKTKGEKATLVALAKKSKDQEPEAPKCTDGIERVRFQAGMPCPVCRGSKMETKFDGHWD